MLCVHEILQQNAIACTNMLNVVTTAVQNRVSIPDKCLNLMHKQQHLERVGCQLPSKCISLEGSQCCTRDGINTQIELAKRIISTLFEMVKGSALLSLVEISFSRIHCTVVL